MYAWQSWKLVFLSFELISSRRSNLNGDTKSLLTYFGNDTHWSAFFSIFINIFFAFLGNLEIHFLKIKKKYFVKCKQNDSAGILYGAQ
jgi:hypothetical protein